jgi:hypothetical protein
LYTNFDLSSHNIPVASHTKLIPKRNLRNPRKQNSRKRSLYLQQSNYGPYKSRTDKERQESRTFKCTIFSVHFRSLVYDRVFGTKDLWIAKAGVLTKISSSYNTLRSRKRIWIMDLSCLSTTESHLGWQSETCTEHSLLRCHIPHLMNHQLLVSRLNFPS